jgi:hypothetical protein
MRVDSPRKSHATNILIELQVNRCFEEVLIAQKAHSLHVELEFVIVWVLDEY